MREAAHFYQILHRQIRRRHRRLRKNRQTFSELAVREAVYVLPLKGNGALQAGHNTRNSLQRRALATAVRTDNRGYLALRNLQGNVMHNRFIVNADIDMIHLNNRLKILNIAHQISLLNKNKKKGAPKKAMMMPTGSSIGAKITRAKVSLSVTIAMPSNADAGSSSL